MLRICPGLLLLVIFSGCASWRKHGVRVPPPQKLRVAILPLDLDFKVKSPADLETVVSSGTVAKSEQKRQADAIKARLKEELAAAFELRVSSSYILSPISHVDVERAMVALNISTTAALSPTQYQELARNLNADAVLRVKVHGYGRIKKSWLLFLWGTSFVEGGAQGVVVAEAAANVWAAAAVAAEDVVQEAFEWFGGGYLFNRYYAPVIIEGDLYSGRTGKNIWGRWFVVTKNKKAAKKLSKAEQKKREVLLFLTFQKARDEMIKKLEKTVLKNEEVESGSQ